MEKEFKGLIPTIMDMANKVDPATTYDPFTIASFNAIVNKLMEQDEQRRQSGWKPQFLLSEQLAEELPYDMLKYLCDKYSVIGSLKTSLILERKEKEYMSKKQQPLHFIVDGPWDSEADTKAYQMADEAFELYKSKHPYVALIRSHHDYSQGYWVEFEKKAIKFPDLLLKSATNGTE